MSTSKKSVRSGLERSMSSRLRNLHMRNESSGNIESEGSERRQRQGMWKVETYGEKIYALFLGLAFGQFILKPLFPCSFSIKIQQ
jgi:hypothetical protein